MADLAELDDAAALRQWAAGDVHVGRVLVERHFDAIFRFFRSKLDRGAEDLTQQVFAACAAQAGDYRGEGSVRAFLFGIARNQLFKHFRQQRRERDAMVKGARSAQAVAGSPSSALRARTELQVLHAALRRLPVDLQILVGLHYWEHLTMTELSAVLQAPSGTIKTRLARARTLLRREIAAVDAEPRLLRSTVDGFDHFVVALRTTPLDRVEPSD